MILLKAPNDRGRVFRVFNHQLIMPLIQEHLLVSLIWHINQLLQQRRFNVVPIFPTLGRHRASPDVPVLLHYSGPEMTGIFLRSSPVFPGVVDPTRDHHFGTWSVKADKILNLRRKRHTRACMSMLWHHDSNLIDISNTTILRGKTC